MAPERRRSARLAGEALAKRRREEVDLVVDEEIADIGDVGAGIVAEEAEGEPSSGRLSRRARDMILARGAALRFAYFKQEDVAIEDEKEDGLEELDDENGDVNCDDVDDWPGPFATAMKIIEERKERLRARWEKAEAETEPSFIQWNPTRKDDFPSSKPPPSLRELAVKVLAANADHLESLKGIPEPLIRMIALKVYRMGTMGFRFLRLLVSHQPIEIYVRDCSWVTEDDFLEIFRKCNTETIEVLRLDYSGRCLPDDVLSSTLVSSPNCLPRLVSISLIGNYRLSDDGLKLIACSAPNLQSINLSQCSLITSVGIIKLLEHLDGVREMILDDCQNVSANVILPALKKLKQLQSLSVSRLEDVNDKFVCGLVLASTFLEELSLAGCLKVSVKSMKAIGEHCPGLHTINLCNIVGLNDSGIAHLASGCISLRKLLLQCNDCSDEAIAAFIEASGNSLVDLSLNSLKQVSDHTALAISRRCSSTLQTLDLSFCRLVSDKALGLIVDSCSQLKLLKLFGCTQVTDLFLKGHSNPGVRIIGIDGNILNCVEMVPELLGDW